MRTTLCKTIVRIDIAIMALVLTACSEPVSEPAQVLRPVKHTIVHSGAEAIRNRVFSGTTHAAQETDLSFKVDGTITRVGVNVGDKVQRGDLIAELDPETLRVELEQARASQAQAEASRRQAEAEYQRVRRLFANNNASQNELDTALANAESAKAAFNADSQSLRLAEIRLDYTRIIADGDCTVASVNVEPNENVGVGSTIAQVNCGDGWELKIDVPESLISTFFEGLTGSVQFSALRGKLFPAEVTEIGTATGGNTTFPVTLTLDEIPQIIRSGLAAEVTFQFEDQLAGDTGFYLAPSVVGQDEAGTFVYVIEPSEQPGAAILRRRSVEVGGISEIGLEILGGLNDGDKVVTAGQSTASDGLLVRDE